MQTELGGTSGRVDDTDDIVDQSMVDEHIGRGLLQPDRRLGIEDLRRARWHIAHPVDDLALFLDRRVVDEDLEQEAVALRLGQRVDTLVLDGVLRRHDEEWARHRIGGSADRDVPLGHHLEERRLHLCRCTVNFVGEEEVRDNRAELGVELLTALAVDARSEQIGWHEVWRELNAGEAAADDLRERLDRERLGHTGDTLEEDVPASEQSDEDALDELILADDHTLDLIDRTFHELHVVVAERHRSPARVRRGVRLLSVRMRRGQPLLLRFVRIPAQPRCAFAESVADMIASQPSRAS